MWKTLKNLLTPKPTAYDFRRLSDDRLLELATEEGTLTEEVLPLFDAEVKRRGLVLPKAKGPAIGGISHVDDAEKSSSTATPGIRTIDLDRSPFEEVAPLLKVQIFSETGRTAYVSMMRTEQFVMRAFAPGLFAVLVVDFGSFEVSVSAAAAGRWGVPIDELFALALSNLRTQVFVAQNLTFDGGHQAISVIGNGPFVSSLALVAESFAQAVGRAVGDPGLIVAVPNWHTVLIHVVDGAGVREALEPMRELTARFFAYTDAVSDRLYWVPKGASSGAKTSPPFESWIALDAKRPLPAELEQAIDRA